MNDGCSKDHQASSRALQRIVRIGSSGKRSRPAAVATEAELNAWDRRVELIPALVPRGREAVQQPLQQKVIRRGGLAGTRYPRGGGGESGRRPGAAAEAGPAGAVRGSGPVVQDEEVQRAGAWVDWAVDGEKVE